MLLPLFVARGSVLTQNEAHSKDGLKTEPLCTSAYATDLQAPAYVQKLAQQLRVRYGVAPSKLNREAVLSRHVANSSGPTQTGEPSHGSLDRLF